MKNRYTHITLVLDRSGSMENVIVPTIDAVNEFVSGQKMVPGYATYTLVLFDDFYEPVHDFVNLKDVPKLTRKTYFTRGRTALHDAICKTANDVGAKLAAMKEEERPERVLFAIMTDGLENASCEFNRMKTADMIKHQSEKYNWDFVFMGADQDSYATAKALNIPMGNTTNYEKTSGGIHLTACEFADSATLYRSGNKSKGKFFDNNQYEFDVTGKPQVKNVTN